MNISDVFRSECVRVGFDAADKEALLREIAREWTERGTFEKMAGSSLSYEELNRWFED